MYVRGEYVQGKCPDPKDEVMREFCDKLSFWVCTTPIVLSRFTVLHRPNEVLSHNGDPLNHEADIVNVIDI